MSFPERTIAQAVALLRIQVRLGVRTPSFGVQMTEGTRYEFLEYRRWAIDYLTAKAERVKYVDKDEGKAADFYGEIAGKRGEDDPRSTH